MNEGAEQEPETAVDADQAVTCVDASENCWLSGSEDAEVRRYEKDRSEMNGLVTSTAGVVVRCIAIDPRGKKVAVTSDDHKVKVVDMEDIINVTVLKGHIGPVRSASWHPTSSLLTTCGSDGKIIVWDVSAEEAKIDKTIEGIIPAVRDTESPEFSYDCSVVWHPSGQYFFAASRSHEIVTISRADWTKTSTFSDKDVSGPITALTISVNGVYLASTCHSKVYIWSTQTRRVIASHPVNSTAIITRLAFSPKENLVAWTDTEGVFSRWHKAVSENYPDPVKKSIVTNSSATVPSRLKTGPNLFGDEESTAPKEPEGDDVDLDAGFGDVDDDWIIDDIGGGLQDPPVTASKKGKDAFVKEMVSITKAQPAFQPGSTPTENKKRYLAYNMLGVIEVTDQDTHHIVNVEFFDRSARKGYHFTDHFKYDLGYLGERGAVFACPPENSHPAQVLYKPYATWTTNSDWTYVLKRPGSAVLGVAAGGLPPSSRLRTSPDSDLQGYGNVIVATTEGDLTFLSGTGRERRIVGLGGDFVSMVAGPEWVFVVHRPGSTTIDGSQNLHYTIINYEDFSVRQRDVLPVPKGHVLKWIGLTDQGAPAMYDSTGYVHILTKSRIPHHACWARILDTNLLERRKGKDESYWPVGVHESNFMCVILKGRQEHPGFPRPLMQELPMRIPFRQDEPREEQIERELLLVQNALDALEDELTTDEIVNRERVMDKEFILLIQAACKTDNTARAIELCKLLHQTAAFDSAIKIAAFYHLVGLKEKIGILKADREENDDRLVVARNKRRRWLKPDPPPREIQVSGGSSSRVDLLGDDRPPPAIERPRMARVTVPIVETTRYTSVAPHAQFGQAAAALGHSRESSLDPVMDPSAVEGKRKRMDNDEFGEGSDVFLPPPPKQKTNPFARRAGQEAPKNPFARKAEANNGKTIYKSESFFDKVGAAEDNANGTSKRPSAKPGNKEKNVVRQTTLFGMPPPPPKEKEKAKKGPRTKKGAEAKSPPPVTNEVPESSQVVDVPMSDAPTLVGDSQDIVNDTQEDTQPDSAWEETQLTEPSEETQVVE